MHNLARNTHKRFRNLLDEIAAENVGLRPAGASNGTAVDNSDLGPSVGDDQAPSPRDMTILGSSVGDDNLGVGNSDLGPSVGDDSPSASGLGPSVGDDAGDISRLGPSVGDDAGDISRLGPSVGEDNPAISGLGPSVGDDEQSSDLRLKQDLRRIGTTVFGLPLYHFRYRGRSETYEGVIAQDVLQVMPCAVSLAADGYYRVNYGALGTSMRRVS